MAYSRNTENTRTFVRTSNEPVHMNYDSLKGKINLDECVIKEPEPPKPTKGPKPPKGGNCNNNKEYVPNEFSYC